MRNEMRQNVRKALALILSLAMAMSTNVTAFAENLAIESSDKVVVVEDSNEIKEDKAKDGIAEPEKGDIVEATTAGDDAIVELEDEKLIKYLDLYYGGDGKYNNSVFDNINYKRNVEGTTLEAGQILKKDIETVEELIFYFNDSDVSSYSFSTDEYNSINLNKDIEKFTALKKLSITSINHKDKNENYLFPELPSSNSSASLESLTMKNVTFMKNSGYNNATESIDLSVFPNLKELEFTNCISYRNKDNTFTQITNTTINKLNTLMNLTKVIVDGSEIPSITLNSDPTSTGLQFSAKNCSKLTSVDLGGYTLKNMEYTDGKTNAKTQGTSLYNCTSLTSLKINKGYADLESQTLDLKQCSNLEKATIKYSFTSESNYLTIDASGLSKGEDDFENEEVIFEAKVNNIDSPQFKLKAVSDSIFDQASSKEAYKKYFPQDGKQVVDTTV